MAYEIRRTPNGRFYMFSNGTDPGYKCSPYYNTLDQMVQCRIDINWNRRPTRDEMRNLIKQEYSKGWIPGKGPELTPDVIPEWLGDIEPEGVISVGDTVYFVEPDNETRIKGRVVRHSVEAMPWGTKLNRFRIKTDDPRYSAHTFDFYESELWKVKP